MPQLCFVAGCPSGREQSRIKSHFFSSPKDPDDFNKWKAALFRGDIQLKPSSKICHHHFNEDEVIKECIVQLPGGGGSVLSLPLTRWRLKPHSIPSRNLPLTTCKSVKNDVQSTSTKTSDCITALLEMHNETRPEVQDVLSEAVSDIGIPADALESCMVIQHDKELHEADLTAVPDAQSDVVTMPKWKCQPIDIDEDEPTLTTDPPHVVKHERELYEVAKCYRLFKKWQQRYYRMKQKYERLERKCEHEGVFVSFSNLKPQEQIYVTGLAAKSKRKRSKRRREVCSVSMEAEESKTAQSFLTNLSHN